MDGPVPSSGYAIGWDVGSWHCDTNPRSRDALVILDPAGDVVGTPWRGNLREVIISAEDTPAFITALFACCRAAPPSGSHPVVLAIDAALAYSREFRGLFDLQSAPARPGRSFAENPYLFRACERLLHAHGWKPLSPIQDMIGSQATKAMHVMTRFSPRRDSTGIWRDETGQLWTLETYPTPCRSARLIMDRQETYPELPDPDQIDALTCSLVARMLMTDPDRAWSPGPDLPEDEGWIWLPRESVPDAVR